MVFGSGDCYGRRRVDLQGVIIITFFLIMDISCGVDAETFTLSGKYICSHNRYIYT